MQINALKTTRGNSYPQNYQKNSLKGISSKTVALSQKYSYEVFFLGKNPEDLDLLSRLKKVIKKVIKAAKEVREEEKNKLPEWYERYLRGEEGS